MKRVGEWTIIDFDYFVTDSIVSINMTEVISIAIVAFQVFIEGASLLHDPVEDIYAYRTEMIMVEHRSAFTS